MGMWYLCHSDRLVDIFPQISMHFYYFGEMRLDCIFTTTFMFSFMKRTRFYPEIVQNKNYRGATCHSKVKQTVPIRKGANCTVKYESQCWRMHGGYKKQMDYVWPVKKVWTFIFPVSKCFFPAFLQQLVRSIVVKFPSPVSMIMTLKPIYTYT